MQTAKRIPATIIAVLIIAFIFYGKPSGAQSMPALPPNYLTKPAQLFRIPFRWQQDTANATREPHAAILIPVQLPGCNRRFFMQFDLGSPYSMFYKNKLAAIQTRYPQTKATAGAENKLLNFAFKAGGMPIQASEIAVRQFDSTGINWHKGSIEIIGTLGADLIDGSVAIIDYPARKITLSPAIPEKLRKRLSLSDFIYAGRRILLPATVQDNPTLLYFDTGSSMFELLTDQKTSESLSVPGGVALQRKMKSWDRYLVANSLPTIDSVELNGQKIRMHFTTYIEGVNAAQAAQMKQMGIGGMTGNKLFLNYKLVIDTNNKKFGLVYQP
jgi:hypothetical protein